MGTAPSEPLQTGFVLRVKVSEKKGEQLLISERIPQGNQAAFQAYFGKPLPPPNFCGEEGEGWGEEGHL